MRTITAKNGEIEFLSEELYVVNNDPHHPEELQRLLFEKKVRLISGVDGSKVPGYHFSKEWVTVCPEDADHPMYIGVRKHSLTKIE